MPAVLKKGEFKDRFHSRSIKDILGMLRSNKKGLGSFEARKRIAEFGANEIVKKKSFRPLWILLSQLNSFLVYILIAATIISYFIGNLVDVYVILSVIVINTGIGFFQEFRAEKSIEALRKIVISYAKVYRDGKLSKINAKGLVPGDIILLEQGDRVPADCRLMETKNMACVESSLTGESLPVEKGIKVLPEKTALAERTNMVWMSTFVASGEGKAVVIGTGKRTAIGRVAHQIERVKDVKSHFREQSDVLGKQMGLIAVIAATITFFIGFFFRGFEFTKIFLFTIASLVSSIPEGLPAILAVVLATGAFRMSRRNAIIRSLPATETLGVVSTIITDKTGTLTQNTINIEKVVFGDREVRVTGKGWEPSGDFILRGKKIAPLRNWRLRKILNIAAVCNESRIDRKGKEYEIIGDPTEAAVLVFAEKAGLNEKALSGKVRKMDDLPFDPARRYRASLSESRGKKEVCAIGAPESILNLSSYVWNSRKRLTSREKKRILSKVSSLSGKGMRVIALAYKEVKRKTEKVEVKHVKDLVFAGFVGMRDPPRPEVKDAITKSKRAGIRVVMTTGDHKDTALAIAKEVGLVELKESKVLTEEDLKALSKEDFEKACRNVNVFARLTPDMKLKIAGVLQRGGHIVAMTGDGINDAPALKKADIGIAMGKVGTDVARASSDMILADDNFASIVNAIEEGRIVFDNTQKSSFYLIATNFAEDATIVATLLFGLPLPLLPTQILLLNLVTDTPGAITLAVEPGHNNLLKRRPRKPKDKILNRELIPFLLLTSVIMAVATILTFKFYIPEGIEKARTGAFMIMAFTQFFNFVNMRSLRESLFRIGVFSNKYMAPALFLSLALMFGVLYIPFFSGIFDFVPLTFAELSSIVAVSSLVLVAGEAYKRIRFKG